MLPFSTFTFLPSPSLSLARAQKPFFSKMKIEACPFRETKSVPLKYGANYVPAILTKHCIE
jgi:hypothetical protein